MVPGPSLQKIAPQKFAETHRSNLKNASDNKEDSLQNMYWMAGQYFSSPLGGDCLYFVPLLLEISIRPHDRGSHLFNHQTVERPPSMKSGRFNDIPYNGTKHWQRVFAVVIPNIMSSLACFCWQINSKRTNAVSAKKGPSRDVTMVWERDHQSML